MDDYPKELVESLKRLNETNRELLAEIRKLNQSVGAGLPTPEQLGEGDFLAQNARG